MGVSIIGVAHFDGTTGEPYSNPSNECVGRMPDGSGYKWINGRYKIHTDQFSAKTILISGLTALSAGGTKDLGVGITSDDSYYKVNKTSIPLDSSLGSSGSVSISVGNLLPNTDYYVWIYCDGKANYCFYDSSISIVASTDYYVDDCVLASDGVFGERNIITISGKVSELDQSFYKNGSGGPFSTVYVECAGRTDTLTTLFRSYSAQSFTCNWDTLVATYAPLVTNAGYANATVYCEVYRKTSLRLTEEYTLVGVSSKTISMTFPEAAVKPSVLAGWATHTYSNTLQASDIAAYVQGYSRSIVSFDSSKITLKYGASISGYSITCNDVTVSSAPYMTDIHTGTTASILCTVTDSRGFTASETLTVTLNGYAPPSIQNTGLDIHRSSYDSVEQKYVADPDGTCISVRATAVYSSILGANNNELNAYEMLVYTKTPSGSWSAQGRIYSNVEAGFQNFSPDNTIDVQIVLTDNLHNTAAYIQRLPTRAWAMKFRPDGNGVGFGKAPESDAGIEMPDTWELRFGEKIIKPDMLGQTEAGSTATSAHASGSYFMWGGNFVKCTADIAVGGNIAGSVTTTGVAQALSSLASTVASHENTLTTTLPALSDAVDENTDALGRISTQTVYVDNITVGQSTYNDTIAIDASRTGYTPIAVAGYNIENATSGGASCSFISIYRIEISNSYVYLHVRNHRSSQAKIKVSVNVLYI